MTSREAQQKIGDNTTLNSKLSSTFEKFKFRGLRPLKAKNKPIVEKNNDIYDQCFINENEDAPKNIRRNCEISQNYNMNGNFYIKNRLPNIM